ncbi:MAG TPA: Flp family type IVb pilin [Sphingobium sp.]|uniref:Flp family type IVb pilin n=1 Tax=unclassified Sphingobium TaxID=2611147 RepID=UPI000EE77C2C|nr:MULTISPECIES: Flp family type IVb pilin [unclassified Sphingobium]WIW87332.1 Flp family type IVb pilin [Sphingobium sp. V4]HAF42402.1 Flp family type IVb pilin [Sphingobium sp.]
MRGLFEIITRRGLLRCERGATAVEYALILAMVVLAMITALTSVANKTIGMWNNVATEVTKH